MNPGAIEVAARRAAEAEGRSAGAQIEDEGLGYTKTGGCVAAVRLPYVLRSIR